MCEVNVAIVCIFSIPHLYICDDFLFTTFSGQQAVDKDEGVNISLNIKYEVHAENFNFISV